MTTETEPKHLQFSTTKEERVFLQDLLNRSGNSSVHILFGNALEQYMRFHSRVIRGCDIVMKYPDGGECCVPISAEWRDPHSDDDAAERSPDTESLDVEIAPDLHQQMVEFVAKGYAPSLTALAGGSLHAHALILSVPPGVKLLARHKDGSEEPL